MTFTAFPCPDEDAEVLLNEYVDGELEPARQPDLFAHLATCADCRAQFDALLAFRLAARQEPLAVPASADAALFSRLDRVRRQSRRARARRADRSPLGGALRQRVSVGAMLAVVCVAAFLGSVLASDSVAAPPTMDERVVEAVLEDGSLYLIDPGVTVEAPRTDSRR